MCLLPRLLLAMTGKEIRFLVLKNSSADKLISGLRQRGASERPKKPLTGKSSNNNSEIRKKSSVEEKKSLSANLIERNNSGHVHNLINSSSNNTSRQGGALALPKMRSNSRSLNLSQAVGALVDKEEAPHRRAKGEKSRLGVLGHFRRRVQCGMKMRMSEFSCLN